MKTTVIYMICRSNNSVWFTPYRVLRGVAKELVERYPATYSYSK